jgi:hypothetical protein
LLVTAWFEFTSDAFDHTSDLPPDSNAGNRFYGRDVAEFIADGLAAREYTSEFLDEDWGWFVRARPATGMTLEIAVYYNIDEDSAAADTWMLCLEEKTRWRRGHPPGEHSRSQLESVFRDAGIELKPTVR